MSLRNKPVKWPKGARVAVTINVTHEWWSRQTRRMWGRDPQPRDAGSKTRRLDFAGHPADGK